MASALICGWLLAPHGAQAKPKLNASARLELAKGPGTEQCLDGKALAQAVEARLQRRVFRADVPATLYVNVAISRADAGWSASLTMHDGGGAFLGRRSLVTAATDCSALDDSLALVVALLVDSPPSPVVEEQEEAPVAPAPPTAAPTNSVRAPQKETEATPISDASAIRLPRDTPAPRAPWRFQLAVEGVAALGMLPGFAPGLELGFGAKAPTFPEFRLFAGWYAPREQLRAGTDAGARFNAAYVGLELCPVEREFGTLEWFVCAGQALGWMRMEAFDFDQNSSSSRLTYALLVRSGVQLALASHWAVRFGIRAEVPFSRGVYTYGTADGGQQELFRPSPVAAVLDLGLIVRL